MIRRTTAFWKVLFITCTLLLGLVSSGFAANFDLVLQWDENTEPDLAVGENPRYKIYYKTGSTGSGVKSGYIGLPASEPDMADEGVSPVPVTVAMDESPDADIVQFTLHNLEDSQSYYIAVTALDDYGNESDLSDEVSYEGVGTAPQNSAPVVASLLVNGTGGTQTIYTNNASGEVEVQIVASDTDGTVDQYLILDNDSNSANGTFASVPGGGLSSADFSVNYQLSGNGSHTLYAWVKDDDGSVSEAITKANIILDRTAPAGSISLSAGDTSHVDVGELTVTATFDESLSRAPVIEITGGGVVDTAAGAMSGSGTVWTKTVTIPADDNTAYAVSVSNITDAAGNTGQALAANFTTDTVDTDGDNIRDHEDADDDNDGMPDTWELEYGLDPKVDDAQLDSDGDGVANIDEYAGQTDPTYPDYNMQPEIPVLLSPENDAIVSLTPDLVISEFDDPDSEDTHTETEWQIYLEVDGSGDCVYELKCDSALTMLAVPSLVLEPTTDYAWRVRVYDNHGAASEWSDYGYFTTGADTADTDNDGIIDDQVPDPGTDVDEDGTADVEQIGIKSIRVKGKGTLIGLGTEDSPQVVKIISFHSIDPTQYADISEVPGSMPYGLIDFKIEVETPGDTVELTIFFSEKISENTAWYKYDCVLNSWTDFSQYTLVSPNLKSITLYLEDGGPGDSDGIANGIIIDPSGIVEVSDTSDPDPDPVPPTDDTAVAAGASGGGGCFIDIAYINKGSILDKFFFWSFVSLFLLFLFVNRNLNKR